MKNEIYLRFEEGLPAGTAQVKGECIKYTYKDGKRVPYIHHYKKSNVSVARQLFEYKLKQNRPKEKLTGPIGLHVSFFFAIKRPQKLWGTYKTTRPDLDNYVKELIDAMTSVGFWEDDAQIAELKVSKRYAEKGTIVIRWEELEE